MDLSVDNSYKFARSSTLLKTASLDQKANKEKWPNIQLHPLICGTRMGFKLGFQYDMHDFHLFLTCTTFIKLKFVVTYT